MQKFETPGIFLKHTILRTILGLLLVSVGLSSSVFASTASRCETAFQEFEFDPHNSSLHQRYKDIESEFDKIHEVHFATNKEDYLAAMKKESNWHRGVYYFNKRGFAERVTERMKILWNRDPSPESKATIGLKLKEIDRLQGKLGDWRERSRPDQRDLKFELLLSEVAPKKDGQNVKKNEELKNWDLAMELATKLARKKGDLTKEDLAQLAVVLQGYTQHPTESFQFSAQYLAKYVRDDEVNFMFTKSKSGRRVLDPLNTFIAGSEKAAALQYFLLWLRKSRDSMHPVIAAARARQYIVSVHPLWDSNGRLARILANYVLMRAGYPPAHIPRGTETENSSVALFPLRDFKDQISPEESIQIMIDGVLRSQQTLLN